MKNAQKEIKSTEAQLKAKKKYANSKYRPNVYIDKNLQITIENHFKSKGFKSFNEYVIALIKSDINQ